MKEILFAADTFKECNMFMNELANDLFNKGVYFDIDKRRMDIRTKNAHLVFVPESSHHCGLFQRKPFDYYIFTGFANWDHHGFNELCTSRINIDAKEIKSKEELIRIICEE